MDLPAQIISIPCDHIIPDPDQPRKHFDPVLLHELELSIAAVGQQEAAVVIPIEGHPTAKYMLSSGERRWTVCTKLKRPLRASVGQFVRTKDDAERSFIAAIVTNTARVDLSTMESARAAGKLMGFDCIMSLTTVGAQLEQVGVYMGRSALWVRHHLSLLTLHPEVQAMLEPTAPEGMQLGSAIAGFLATHVKEHEKQLPLARRIAINEMRANEARALILQIAGREISDRRRPSDDYRKVQSFMSRVRSDVGILLGLPRFRDSIRGQTPETRKKLCGTIGYAIKGLMQLREALLREDPSAATGLLDEAAAE